MQCVLGACKAGGSLAQELGEAVEELRMEVVRGLIPRMESFDLRMHVA